jgi:hypothetical protein
MADGTVRISEAPSGGKLVDNEELTVGGNTVNRQRIQVAGAPDVALANVARIPPSAGDFGLVVRQVDDPHRRTPFGELRVASPFALGDFAQPYGLDPTVMSSDTTNTGAVADLLDQSAVRLSVVASGDRAVQSTRESFRYQPGSATRLRQTVVVDADDTAGLTRRWGQFDDGDGVFFALVDSTPQVVIRSSTSGSVLETQTVAQSAWNQDTLDGSGDAGNPSGATLDLTKVNIFEITYQWLGAGFVDFYVNQIRVHRFENPGALPVPYMKTGILPLRWEVVSSGGAGEIVNVCSGVVSDGGGDPLAYGFGYARPTAASVPTGGLPMVSLRPAATFKTVANRGLIVPRTAFVSGAGGGSDAIVDVVVGGILTGASWSAVNAESMAEVDIAASAITGGIVVATAFLDNAADRAIDLTDVFDRRGRKLLVDSLTGDQDVVTLVGRDAQAGTTDVFGAFNWLEVR